MSQLGEMLLGLAPLVQIWEETADGRRGFGFEKSPLLRQWAGLCDMTPDFAPIMSKTPIQGFYLDAGWGTWGFKATPVCGKRMAETVATGKVPDILEPFRLTRFRSFQQVGEKGAAAVGH